MVIPWMKNGRIGDYIEQLQDEDQFADGRLRVDRWVRSLAFLLAANLQVLIHAIRYHR